MFRVHAAFLFGYPITMTETRCAHETSPAIPIRYPLISKNKHDYAEKAVDRRTRYRP